MPLTDRNILTSKREIMDALVSALERSLPRLQQLHGMADILGMTEVKGELAADITAIESALALCASPAWALVGRK
jgi:hypothetical protein